jgi:hypothetical protein
MDRRKSRKATKKHPTPRAGADTPLTEVRQRRTLVTESTHNSPFVETTEPFEKSVVGVLSEEEVQELTDSLLVNPEQGDVIPKGRGLWKLRWPAQGKGKRGGARIIYYLRLRKGRIQLLYAYLKSKKADLTQQELKELRQWV